MFHIFIYIDIVMVRFHHKSHRIYIWNCVLLRDLLSSYCRPFYEAKCADFYIFIQTFLFMPVDSIHLFLLSYWSYLFILFVYPNEMTFTMAFLTHNSKYLNKCDMLHFKNALICSHSESWLYIEPLLLHFCLCFGPGAASTMNFHIFIQFHRLRATIAVNLFKKKII